MKISTRDVSDFLQDHAMERIDIKEVDVDTAHIYPTNVTNDFKGRVSITSNSIIFLKRKIIRIKNLEFL